MSEHHQTIAYFSMEIAIDALMPTYSGGLGVLAGDMLRSAADLEVPLVAVTLLHRKGYFRQILEPGGTQREVAEEWDPAQHLEQLPVRACISLEGRRVSIRPWLYEVRGITGHAVPVYFLDTDLPENDAPDRGLTDRLYGGDQHYRLCQEAVLGLGGLAILEALAHDSIHTYHLNEGHSALLPVALLEHQLQEVAGAAPAPEQVERVRQSCVFTTHTPVPSGHDQFTKALAWQVLGDARARLIESIDGYHKDTLNMTYLALRLSHYVNGVGMHHGETSRSLFPDYPIRAITNGVHAVHWTSAAFAELFDRHIPEWRRDNLYLRYSIGIPLREIAGAHQAAKRRLLEEIGKRTGHALNEKVLTIGLARRAAAYKRLELLFTDIPHLAWIARQVGHLQIICGGKAHPEDAGGKHTIRRMFDAAAALGDTIPVIYVENYDLTWARLLTSGTDLWLNTPLHPLESSGTSGMKAALNGVPTLSVLDGWWVEGHIEGFTGWAIQDSGDSGSVAAELTSLYSKLEKVILPMYYSRPDVYTEIMRSTIALNGSFFNSQRMVAQYVANAYGSTA